MINLILIMKLRTFILEFTTQFFYLPLHYKFFYNNEIIKF